MNIVLLKIGKPALRQYEDLAAVFLKRISGYTKVSSEVFAARSGQEKSTEALQHRLQKIPSAYIVGLDEHGELWSSPALAAFIEKKRADSVVKHLVFLVGGPYGLSRELKAQCHGFWSLSPAVYPSDLAWLMATEQIYRAFTISHGQPYHHGDSC